MFAPRTALACLMAVALMVAGSASAAKVPPAVVDANLIALALEGGDSTVMVDYNWDKSGSLDVSGIPPRGGSGNAATLRTCGCTATLLLLPRCHKQQR